VKSQLPWQDTVALAAVDRYMKQPRLPLGIMKMSDST
jgi:hypothetical protein